MIFDNINEFIKILPTKKQLLGIDVGTSKSGLSISCPSMIVVTPVITVKTSDLITTVKEKNIQNIVIGCPFGYEDGVVYNLVMKFADLFSKMDFNILLYDEAGSSLAVKELARSTHGKFKKSSHQTYDKLAATYILQNAINDIRTALQVLHPESS